MRIGATAAASTLIDPFVGSSLAASQKKKDWVGLLPKNYDGIKEYPLLFALHPAGRGQEYLRVLSPLANSSHAIVAASTSYANGQKFDEFVPKVKAAVEEITKAYKVKKGGVYLVGLSGGGMAAYVACHQNPDLIDGVIINNGSVHPSVLDDDNDGKWGIKKAAIISGKKDKVIPPDIIERDAKLLEKVDTKVKVFTFSGAHTFAPASVYQKALEWMESK